MKRFKPFFLNIFSLIFAILVVSPLHLGAQDELTEPDFFLEGIKEFNIGDFEKAKSLLGLAIKENPKNDAAHYYTGLSFFNLNNIPDAEKHLKAATDLDPSNFWYRIKLAQFYAATQNIELALALYEDLKTDFPKKSSIYYDIIDLYTTSGQIEKAYDTLEQIESLRGVNQATGTAKYELLNMMKKHEEAAIFLEEFEKKYSSPRTAFILGDIYKNKFKDTTAIYYYSKAISMDPSFSPAYFGLAEVYRMTRQFGLFFENIKIFLKDPKMEAQIKASYMKEAIFNPQFIQVFKPQIDSMISSIVDAHPADSTSLLLAGAYYVQTERPEKGKELYLQNAQKNPDNPKASIEYVSLLYFLKEWDALISFLDKSIERFPKEISFVEILAIAYWQSEDIDRAISTYEKILKDLPKESPMLLQSYSSLGDLYQIKGSLSKAYSAYEKALKINPTYNPVLNNYAYYLSLEERKLKKAREMSKITIKSEPDNPTYLDTYAWILYLVGEPEEAKGYFKHAMIYGGKESAVIMDHYAHVLYALKEYDLAFIYWEQAHKMDQTLGIAEKIAIKKAERKKQL